jgi:hypothetical protein
MPAARQQQQLLAEMDEVARPVVNFGTMIQPALIERHLRVAFSGRA